MKPNDTTTDRETLSALFDGELGGDARLFATRRLSHDAGWQDDCGRWQLIGDAMRREAPIAAPSDLAERVRRALQATPAALDVAPAVRTVATPMRRRRMPLWVGGALAASVALVAVFVARAPQDGASNAPSATIAASTPVATPAVVDAPIDTVMPTTPSPIAAPTTVADAPRVASVDRPTPRTAAPRVAARAAEAATAVAVVAQIPADANPFHVPAADPLAARPWPRASLSGASGAFTASYGAPGDARADAPSFYPFEPRVPASDDATP